MDQESLVNILLCEETNQIDIKILHIFLLLISIGIARVAKGAMPPQNIYNI